MERLSDKAIEIINDLHTERLDYTSEYVPLIEAAQKLSSYEDTGLEPEEVFQTKLALEGKLLKEKYHIGDTVLFHGYEIIKVSNDDGFWNAWKPKANVVWESHFGKIPDGNQVVFLNGNKRDIRIENLACISKQIAAKMANGHGKSLWSESPDITKTAILACELELTIKCIEEEPAARTTKRGVT